MCFPPIRLFLLLIIAGKRLNFGGGEKTPLSVSSSRRDSDSPDLVATPANRDTNRHDDSDEDIVMQPKSLAATFDCFSDDE